MKPLFYSEGREMNPRPEGYSLLSLAQDLRNGPVAVTLEPGDATRYDLLLVPMNLPMCKIGNYGPGDEDAGLVVVRIVGGHTTGCGIVLLNRGGYIEDLPRISNNNPWTEELFRWWFGCLWEVMSDRQLMYANA